MADEAKAYPSVPARHWYALRERFKKSIPRTVTANFLASALQMTELSARSNILPGLKSSGLLADDGTPSDLAIKWRDDTHYKETCEHIRATVYPQELLDLAPPESATFEEVKGWFARAEGIGESAARKMASFYMMLCAADPNGVSARPEGNKPSTTPRATKPPGAKAARGTATPKLASREEEAEKTQRRMGTPSLSLNLQILISPDATAEQIDKIFESMAKHLRDFN